MPDTEMLRPEFDIVVVGGSMGSLKPLEAVIANLPASFPVPIVVATHRGDDPVDLLPAILAARSPLAFKSARDDERLAPGCVYFPPPRSHLRLDRTLKCRLEAAGHVSRFRPSIDLLFGSAADAFGSRTLGIILSGRLKDGAEGAAKIRSKGGVVITQSPESAKAASMPFSTIENGSASFVLDPPGISRALISLTMVAGARSLFGALAPSLR